MDDECQDSEFDIVGVYKRLQDYREVIFERVYLREN